MSGRIFSMKELGENDEEWRRPSNIVQTKAGISATKRELLERICELEAENAKLVKTISEREKAVDFIDNVLWREREDANKIRSQLKVQVAKNEFLEAENADLKNQLRDALERC